MFGVDRQMLHAYKLSFLHPITKKSIEVIAPYKADILMLLSWKRDA